MKCNASQPTSHPVEATIQIPLCSYTIKKGKRLERDGFVPTVMSVTSEVSLESEVKEIFYFISLS